MKAMNGIVRHGLIPGGQSGDRKLNYFVPFAPWDDEGSKILRPKVIPDEVKVALYIPAMDLMNFGARVDTDGRYVTTQTIPFSAFTAAWYESNTYEWIRLLAPSGAQFVAGESRDFWQIASRTTLCDLVAQVTGSVDVTGRKRLSKIVNDIKSIVEELRKEPTFVLSAEDARRSKLVDFCVRYGQPDVGLTICPACLNDTPIQLALCLHCRGAMICAGKVSDKPAEVVDVSSEDEEQEEKLKQQAKEAKDKTMKAAEEEMQLDEEPTAEEREQRRSVRMRQKKQSRCRCSNRKKLTRRMRPSSRGRLVRSEDPPKIIT